MWDRHKIHLCSRPKLSNLCIRLVLDLSSYLYCIHRLLFFNVIRLIGAASFRFILPSILHFVYFISMCLYRAIVEWAEHIITLTESISLIYSIVSLVLRWYYTSDCLHLWLCSDTYQITPITVYGIMCMRVAKVCENPTTTVYTLQTLK